MPDSEILDRQPPRDLDAEKGVLGSVLLLPSVLDDVMELIGPDDFYDDANGVIFGHLVGFHRRGERPDETLLVASLKATGDWERAGGAVYLYEIGCSVPHALNAKHYAKIIQRLSKLRRFWDAAVESLQAMHDEARPDPDELCGRFARQLDDIAAGQRAAYLVTAETAVGAALKNAHDRYNSEVVTGLPTGLHDYDRQLGGLHNGELVVLAARPGVGKTSLALQVAVHNAIDGQVILYCSCEMSATELATRVLCARSKVSSRRIRTATLNPTDLSALDSAGDTLREAALHIDDTPGRKVRDVRLAARRLKRQGGLAMVVVDYLQMLEVDDKRLPRHTAVGNMSRDLKNLARELDIPVLCLAQLNRTVESTTDHKPRLSHLRESGGIEQDADVVAFIHREELYRRNDPDVAGQAELIVAKNRNGPEAVFRLTWDASATTFRTAALPAQQQYDFGEWGDGT